MHGAGGGGIIIFGGRGQEAGLNLNTRAIKGVVTSSYSLVARVKYNAIKTTNVPSIILVSTKGFRL